ncbi:Prenylcysteine lyase-domain-containing protein [Thelephora terrestris]|uniref:Prenylcysteine lyase-domain-containing protein n=1 Tax=Thelephora terrestris TaxID=56493 RepID=A0A9P6L7H7_9AGAM|nr:Prenylcysteine lyase-domain-containing protein [Thelephora terrestris]
MLWTAYVLVAAGTAQALSLPFRLPSWLWFGGRSNALTIDSGKPWYNASKTVAIIGAGAGGTSTAFFIAKAKQRYGVDIDIHMYDKNEFIGGDNDLVHPYDDERYRPVELGASKHYEIDQNLARAAKEFNLTRIARKRRNDGVGFWNGSEILFTLGGSPFPIWDRLKTYWTYGFWSLSASDTILDEVLHKARKLYAPDTQPWDEVSSLIDYMEWSNLTSQSGADFFRSSGVSERQVSELLNAAIRATYSQNAGSINALGAALANVQDTFIITRGGHRQVFENFAREANSTLFLGSQVKSIKWNSNADAWTVKSTNGSIDYRNVVLAAPIHTSHISLPESLTIQVPGRPHESIFTTVLTTNASHPNPAYFGLKPTATPPRTIFTTATNDGEEPEFLSLKYYSAIQRGQQEEYVVKILSKEQLPEESLERLFGPDSVKWVYTHEWKTPVLTPTTTFPPIRLDKGFYYVNAFDSVISTIESSIVSGRNVADLLLREDFSSGVCVKPTSEPHADQEVFDVPPSPQTAASEFVYGWDC